MIKLKKVLAGIMASTLMLSAVGCGMIEKTEEGIKNTVVAKVYNEKITLGEVDAGLVLFFNQLKQVYGENYKTNNDAIEYVKKQRAKMLDTMVNDIIFAKKAEELGIMPSEEELDKQSKEQLDQVKASFDGDEAYQSALKDAGITEEDFLKELRLSVVSKIVYDDIVKDVEVTDDEITAYYNANQSSYTEGTNRIDPAHILVKTEEEAKDIIKKLDEGADFAALAKEFGTDGTAEKGGDLGWINYDSTEYDKTFLLAAIALEKGKYTPAPIQTQFGYHVIKCLDKEEYPIKPLEDVKEDVKKAVLEQNQYNKYVEVVTEWQKAAKIKTYEDKLGEM